MAPRKPPDFSNSERQRLQEIADEHEHMEWLRKRRKERFESIRGWITWLTAAWALKDLLLRDLLPNWGWLKDLWK